MADWLNPTLTTNYDVFLAEMKARDVEVATMYWTSATNIPTGTMRYHRGGWFEEWNGTAWVTKVLSVAGGGTGATTGSGAGTSLGLGNMAYQNNNAVNITWGQATLYYLGLHSSISLAADGTYDLGGYGTQWNRAYFRNALVIPVGADKFATS